jgi:metal-responsive CopG/Arc/MetJ family transcriptional regulator
MRTAKIAISIDHRHLQRLDYFVKRKVFKNRSQAIQNAVVLELKRLEHSRLAEECAKLDPTFEKNMAEEGLVKTMNYKELSMA